MSQTIGSIVFAEIMTWFGVGIGWFAWGRELKALQEERESMTIATRAPKLTSIISPIDLMNWLGETIQEKAGKENAGLIEISTDPKSSTVTLRHGKTTHEISITTRRRDL